MIGTVATGLRAVKISDLSRVRRFNATVQNSVADERQSRSIALPGLKGAMSHLAMPIRCQKRLVGVLLVESRNRMAFGHAAEVLVEAMARLAGVAIAYSEVGATVEPPVAQTAPVSPPKSQTAEKSDRRKVRR